MCFYCVSFVLKNLLNTAMSPTKLNRHFITNHTNMKNEAGYYFYILLKLQNKQSAAFGDTITDFLTAKKKTSRRDVTMSTCVKL